VDDPGFCDFYAPAVVSRGEFQIAISTGGNSPLLSQNVRKELEEQFGPEYGPWTAWLGRMRSDLRSLLPPTQRRKELLHLLTLLKPQGASKASAEITRRLVMQESKRAELTARLKEVLKEHQRDGLSMIGKRRQAGREPGRVH